MYDDFIAGKNYDFMRGLKKTKCEDCGKKLMKKDAPKRFIICKKCRDTLDKAIDRMNKIG